MADHVRARIRAALVTLLTDCNDEVGRNVFSGRARPLQDEQLPALDIDNLRGGQITAETLGGANRFLSREPIMTLAVNVKKGEGYLELIDTIYKDIEVTLAGDNTLGGLCKYIVPYAEPVIDVSGEGERIVARAEQQFLILYYTALNAPDQPF